MEATSQRSQMTLRNRGQISARQKRGSPLDGPERPGHAGRSTRLPKVRGPRELWPGRELVDLGLCLRYVDKCSKSISPRSLACGSAGGREIDNICTSHGFYASFESSVCRHLIGSSPTVIYPVLRCYLLLSGRLPICIASSSHVHVTTTSRRTSR